MWYQLKMDEADGSFKLTGGHDVDQSWIAKLREPLTQVRQWHRHMPLSGTHHSMIHQ